MHPAVLCDQNAKGDLNVSVEGGGGESRMFTDRCLCVSRPILVVQAMMLTTITTVLCASGFVIILVFILFRFNPKRKFVFFTNPSKTIIGRF